MALKQYKPNTPGQRGLVLVDKSDLYKGKPEKKLTEGLSKNGGRNHTGKITMWQRGGGHKRRYRLIDFKRRNFDITGVVERIEYDPNRTAYIALVKYDDNELRYIIAPQRLNIGDKIISSGRNRWLGKRPSVRGVAMNPVDHPHGGGEGRTSGGRHPVTPWGKPTKGYRTRNNKRTDKLIIRRRKV